jgi:hypothetical protein
MYKIHIENNPSSFNGSRIMPYPMAYHKHLCATRKIGYFEDLPPKPAR